MIAVDLPGFGARRAARRTIEPTAANLAAAVSELCSELGIERPHVAGNSLGGWVGARDGPGRLGRLGLRDLPRRALARAARARGASTPRRWARRLRPARLAVLRTRRRGRERDAAPRSPRTPSGSRPRPAAALVLDWIDARGYDAANRAMRSHVFEPAGYPERPGDDRLGRARPPGLAAAARADARPAPATWSSRASATRRPGTTRSWSRRRCCEGSAGLGARLSSGRVGGRPERRREH